MQTQLDLTRRTITFVIDTAEKEDMQAYASLFMTKHLGLRFQVELQTVFGSLVGPVCTLHPSQEVVD